MENQIISIVIQPLCEGVQHAAIPDHHQLQVLPLFLKVDFLTVIGAADHTISVIQSPYDAIGVGMVMDSLKLFVNKVKHLAASPPKYQGILTLLLFFCAMITAIDGQDDVFIVFNRRLAEELSIDKRVTTEALYAFQAVELNFAGISYTHFHEVMRDLIR